MMEIFTAPQPLPSRDRKFPDLDKMQAGTFDEILNLEEQFYASGYEQGLADGTKAGRIEGRTFGLEKGFEKYVESGRLHGKSLVWANRIPQLQKNSVLTKEKDSPDDEKLDQEMSPPSHDGAAESNSTSGKLELPNLGDNARLIKNVTTLYALAESESLSTENTEEAVTDFDDRMKRAVAKVKMIERMTGESKGTIKSSNDESIEDVSVLKARH
jgi:hypothetical protein